MTTPYSPGFLVCLAACVNNDELVQQFNRLKGFARVAPSPIEQLIDRATGYDKVLEAEQERWAEEFVWFVRDCVWERLAPAVRLELEEKAR